MRLHPSFPFLHPARTPTQPLHHDLSSFLAYARRTSLPKSTTLYTGTHYEYTSLHALARLGLSLVRTGGADDKGIDLRGTWRLPSLKDDGLRVVVQCKALGRKVSPAVVREMEGVVGGVVRGEGVAGTRREREVEVCEEGRGSDELERPAQPAGRDVMALLVSPREATKGVRDAVARSRWPIGYAKIALAGGVEQLLWNRRAAEIGFEGVGVVVRHLPPKVAVGEGEGEDAEVEMKVDAEMEMEMKRVKSEVVLMWKGEPWEWDQGELKKVEAEIDGKKELRMEKEEQGGGNDVGTRTERATAAG